MDLKSIFLAQLEREPRRLGMAFLQLRDDGVPLPLAPPSVLTHQAASGVPQHRDRRRTLLSWNPNSTFAQLQEHHSAP